MVYVQTRICPTKMRYIKFSGGWNRLPNPSQKNRSHINKQVKNLSTSGFCHSSRVLCVNKKKWKDRQVFGSCQGPKKKRLRKMRVDNDTNCSLCPWNNSQRPGKKDLERNGDQRNIWDHPEYLEEF